MRSQLINRYLFSFSHCELSISMKQHSKNYCTLSILDLHFMTRSNDLCFLDLKLLLKRQLLHHILIVVNLNMSFQFNGDNFILVDIIARLLIDTDIIYPPVLTTTPSFIKTSPYILPIMSVFYAHILSIKWNAMRLAYK